MSQTLPRNRTVPRSGSLSREFTMGTLQRSGTLSRGESIDSTGGEGEKQRVFWFLFLFIFLTTQWQSSWRSLLKANELDNVCLNKLWFLVLVNSWYHRPFSFSEIFWARKCPTWNYLSNKALLFEYQRALRKFLSQSQ